MDLDAPLPVVVAVDATGSTDRAVEWAAAEAAARHLPLRIVHVLTTSLSVDPSAAGAVIAQIRTERAKALDLVARAADRTAAVVPDLEPATAVLDGPVGWALRREAERSSALVLGSRSRRTRCGRWFADSVSGALIASAPCPVVVVRPPGRSIRGVPAVVVGHEAGPAGADALRYARAAADQRGVPLLVVDGGDAAELAETSAGASLLVLVAVGRRRVLRATPSPGRALLTQPGCPLAVVRTQARTKHQATDEMRPWTASSGSN